MNDSNRDRQSDDDERGQRASVDRSTGEVHGSGSGAGGGGNPDEDYDKDSKSGAGAEPEGGPKPAAQSEGKIRDKHEGHYG